MRSVQRRTFVFDESSDTFSIVTGNIAKTMDLLKTYQLRFSVKYAGEAYTNKDDLDFTVTLSDPCIDAEITIDPAIITTQIPTKSITYTIGRPAVEFGPFDTSYLSSNLDKTSANCPQFLYFLYAENLNTGAKGVWPLYFPAFSWNHDDSNVVIESSDLA